jgi:hypothetical protein
MRYLIQLATSTDVAVLASMIDETREHEQRNADSDASAMPLDRLLQTCACSTQVWAARDRGGVPSVLWGVTPMVDDPEIGHLWMLAGEAFDDRQGELEALSRLVFGEMLSHFMRLENYVDSRKIRAIDLLRSIGFAVDPKLHRQSEGADFHRVWIDSVRLQGGNAVSRLLH